MITDVRDPYRWLEDDRSKETESWVIDQNKTTFDYLGKIPFITDLKKRLEYLWNYEKFSAPFKEGEYTYFYKNDGLQNQYVVYRQKDDEDPEIFLNPNHFSEDGTISLGSLSFSKSGSIVAYSISEGGSDWRKIVLMNVKTKEIMDDTICNVKFSGISWKKMTGSSIPVMTSLRVASYLPKQININCIITRWVPIKKMINLFLEEAYEEKHRYVSGNVTEDGNYLFISASISTSGNKLYMKDLTKNDASLVTILDHTDSDTYVIDNQESKLFLVTNLEAPNKKIVTVDATNPTPNNWVDFIPETEHVLSPSTGNGYFFAEYMVDAVSNVKQYNYLGDFIADVYYQDLEL